MIYPDVSVEEWEKRYPNLFDRDFWSCLCGATMKNPRPWVSKHSAGIEFTACECGRGKGSVSTEREGTV